jgi:CheY-like chemotaxis protein
MMPAHERITLIGLDDDPAPPQAARPGEPDGPASASHAAARLKHVLVVDADEELFRTLVAWIEPFGFAVHRAADAADAADRAGERRFDHALVRASAEPDGGATLAATLRRAARDRSLTPPRVALFGPPQALSAALAGSTPESSEVDAVLQLPLRHKDLLELLGGHTLRRQDFSPTLPQTDFA